ncbi:MAG: hypothetical protein DLM69_11370 [Candidatus Chloroheliales bacterium]|nr:MAG: hypothetical protein DLM69_11370 [Chloroflexota bacterium]
MINNPPASDPLQSAPVPQHHRDHDVFLLPTRVDRLPDGNYAIASSGLPGLALIAADLIYGLLSYEQLARTKRVQLFNTLKPVHWRDAPFELDIVLLVPFNADNVENYHATIRVESTGADNWHITCHELPGISVTGANLADALRDIGPRLVEGIRAWKTSGKPFHRDLCPLTQDRLPDTFTITMVRLEVDHAMAKKAASL